MIQKAQKIYSTTDVLEMLGVSKATLYRMIKSEVFPSPSKVSGKRKNGWLDGTLEEWQSRLTKNTEVVG